ncbi:MAG: peroxidase family protein [Acidobacteriota bacterium]
MSKIRWFIPLSIPFVFLSLALSLARMPEALAQETTTQQTATEQAAVEQVADGVAVDAVTVEAPQNARSTDDNPESPIRQIRRQPAANPAEPRGPGGDRLRSIDGSGNNRNDPEMGAAHTQLLRLAEPAYGDGVSALAGDDRPNPRRISNIVNAQGVSIPNPQGFTDYFWQWGQFLDHDIDLTDGIEPAESAPIAIPAGDAHFDPQGTGAVSLSLNRSLYDQDTGLDASSPRQQINEITAWIDASNVYGSDDERAEALRTLDGTGQLKTSEGDLLPFNVDGLPNAGGDSEALFLAGDVRANEQVGLAAMHTLFVREHNRQARRIAAGNPQLSGDQVYQRARRIVGAQMQVITYREFLPVLLGPDPLEPYRGYRPQRNAAIANVFSTAAYRFGHSALSPTLLRLDADGEEIDAGHLSLRDAFFAPHRLTDEGGIEPILRGLAAQVCQRVDPFVVDDIRNFLFGPPGAGGFDLAALNIQRGRDHGLPSYNDLRRALGLRPARNFGEISSSQVIRRRLQRAYGNVERVDVWVGGLAEDRLPGAMVGELVGLILADQFAALRDGDRFWYQNALSPQEVRAVENTRLSDIIRRNTTIGDELQDDVFRVANP